MKYIISVGTNMGDRKKNIENAVEALNNIPYTDVIEVSSIYQTEPVDYVRQDDFYNAIFVVKTKFNPNEMLGICLGIESGFGRVRGIKCGPRILDLDVIFAENLEIDEPNLIVPHPRYSQRRFILEPLLEIFPSGEVFGINFKQYIADIDGQYIKKIDKINHELICDEF
jgi:2-amino-4-hydroxy-6-hydroxymethyldihydropteridine diphosphokinase